MSERDELKCSDDSDKYINELIQQHGYRHPLAIAARLEQWISLYGGQDAGTLTMYEAMKALRSIQPVATQEDAGKVQARPEILDCPIPCDVTVGDGVVPKGCKFDTLLTRMWTFSAKHQDASHPSNAVQDAPDEEHYRMLWAKHAAKFHCWPSEVTPERDEDGRFAWGQHETEFRTYYAGVRDALKAATVPQVVQAPSDEQIEAAAKVMAECMDYPWEYMPEEGRSNMRKDVLKIITTASNAGEAMLGEKK